MTKFYPGRDKDSLAFIEEILNDGKYPVKEEHRPYVKGYLVSAINLAINGEIAKGNTKTWNSIIKKHYGIPKVSKVDADKIETVTVKVNGRNKDITCPAVISVIANAIKEIKSIEEQKHHKSPAWHFRDLKRFLLKHGVYPTRNSVDKLIQRVLLQYEINADISSIQTQTKGIKY